MYKDLISNWKAIRRELVLGWGYLVVGCLGGWIVVLWDIISGEIYSATRRHEKWLLNRGVSWYNTEQELLGVDKRFERTSQLVRAKTRLAFVYSAVLAAIAAPFKQIQSQAQADADVWLVTTTKLPDGLNVGLTQTWLRSGKTRRDLLLSRNDQNSPWSYGLFIRSRDDGLTLAGAEFGSFWPVTDDVQFCVRTRLLAGIINRAPPNEFQILLCPQMRLNKELSVGYQHQEWWNQGQPNSLYGPTITWYARDDLSITGWLYLEDRDRGDMTLTFSYAF